MLSRHFRILAGALALAMTPVLSHAQQAPDAAPDLAPEAVELMKAMTAYLVTLKQFTISGQSSRETVLHTGQKVMGHEQFTVQVRRPNRFHLSRRNGEKDLELIYDGENLTLFGKTRNLFATTKAPPTIDEAFDFAADILNISASARDLIYEDAYDELMSEVFEGRVVGKALVDGVLCRHLAFRSEEADWQIWIEEGDKPLPRKYVITSRWLAGGPNYSARFSKWNSAAKVADAQFVFTPPKGASRIRFLGALPMDSKPKNVKKSKKEPSS
jgi:hypothetical protein